MLNLSIYVAALAHVQLRRPSELHAFMGLCILSITTASTSVLVSAVSAIMMATSIM